MSPELARTMCEIAQQVGRDLGVLINRRGHVVWIIVGEGQRLYLPNIGRLRARHTHFRGLRLVHIHLNDESLSKDDLSDLALLRLDYVAAVSVKSDGLPGRVQGAYLLPGKEGDKPWQIEEFPGTYALKHNFLAFITEIEAEFAAKAQLLLAHAQQRECVMLVDVSSRVSDGEDNLEEMCELARTAGVEVVCQVLQVRAKVDPRYLVGRGKLEEIVLEALRKGAELILFGRDISPAQARAIADFTELRVLDRTQLILDIFAKRALTREGKLQVELAQLKYRLPRLTREDSGLSRLVGGIGGRGPGETKLELDRRRTRDRIARLEKEIEKLACRRAVRRSQRERNHIPIVALVGYTNAGKSTLLNQLTSSRVFVEDKLFATLDPMSRRLRFPQERQIILIDTVGFIRALPSDLFKAFRATFEELAYADLLLHVVDVLDEHVEDKIATTTGILEELGLANIPQVLLLNKCDGVKDGRMLALARRTHGIVISALKKKGFTQLLSAIEDMLWRTGVTQKGYIFKESNWGQI